MIEFGKVDIITNNAQVVAASMKVYDVSTLGASEFGEDFDFPNTDFEQKGFSQKWQKVHICTKDLAKISINYQDYYKKVNNSNTVYFVNVVMEIETE